MRPSMSRGMHNEAWRILWWNPSLVAPKYFLSMPSITSFTDNGVHLLFVKGTLKCTLGEIFLENTFLSLSSIFQSMNPYRISLVC